MSDMHLRKHNVLLVTFSATLLLACALQAQVADGTNGVVAGIPVNYTEAKVGLYELPDPLTLSDGRKVADAKTWSEKRRPEIVRLYEQNQFGRSPDRPKDLSFDVFDKGTPAFDGKAIRRQVTINFSKNKSAPKMDLLIYLPAGASNRVPLLLNAGFTANSLIVDDPGVKPGEIWNREKQRVPASGGRRPPRPSLRSTGRGMDRLRGSARRGARPIRGGAAVSRDR